MDNKKLFNMYVFLTTFSRNLIEVFIGTILYKLGFSIREVIFYYVMVNAFSLIIAIPITHISKKYSNKLLSVIGVLAFLCLQISLNCINTHLYCLFIVSFFFALYRRAYWISRRYYTMQIMDDKKNIATRYSIISIINQLGVIVSAYVGALLLQFVSIKIITIISFILLGISLIILYKLDFTHERNNIKINLLETFKCTPKSSILNIACYEMQNVVKFLFPLFIILYVKNTYTTIGIVNLIANIASLIFTYVYGKVINSKKNYLALSIFLFVLIKCLEINSFGIFLLVLSFLEGFAARMYEQSFHKEHFKLSKNFEYQNYNYLYEIVQDVSRFLMMLLLFLFVKDIRIMLYIIFIFMSLGILFNFKTSTLKDNSEVLWK